MAILTRRSWMMAAGGVALARVDYRDYSRVLPDFLRGLAAESYRKRNAALAAVKTAAQARERQKWASETFWDLTGGAPERTPLNARVMGRFERAAYVVEKVVFESRPGLVVPANLYIPKAGRAPYPAVLFQMGHSLNGKGAGTYQRCCQGLAQLGFLVLAFDPMGQGERTYYPRPGGWLTRLPSADDEHTVPGRQMLLCGDTSTRLQTWDAVRALDYLAAHPLADPTRLASTGQSGGGTLTMFLAAVDPRLACAAVACGNTENVACANFNPPGSTDDAEQNFLASAPRTFDRWDTLYPMAPRPLLVLASSKDFFGTYSPNYISNGREEFGKLMRVYRLLDGGERLEWFETPLPHNLSYPVRVAIYDWFSRWMTAERKPVTDEPPTAPEDDETLWVAKTGSVVRDLKSETPFSLNVKRAEGIRTPDRPDGLAELLRLPRPLASPAVVLGATRLGQTGVEALEVESERGVWVPAWLYLPRQKAAGRALLVLAPGGRNAGWREDEMLAVAASRGVIVCAADVRGIGDLRPEYPRGAVQHGSEHQHEEHYAWSSLIFGRPLLGQRVADLLALADALLKRREIAERGLAIAARAALTAPALFAAALDTRVQSVYLSGGLVSYRNLAQTEDYAYPLANIVPRMLERADFPQIAASMAPRRVIVAGAVDAARRPLSTADVRRIYAAANVDVRPAAEWNADALVEASEAAAGAAPGTVAHQPALKGGGQLKAPRFHRG
jgi:cephalosporin-C deacetylase-like acetyl esterase